MGRQPGRVGLLLAGSVLALLAVGGPAMGAEEPPPTPSGFVGYLENPVPANLPFRLTGEVDLGVQKLEGQRGSPGGLKLFCQTLIPHMRK